jgi:hypothetical protein
MALAHSLIVLVAIVAIQVQEFIGFQSRIEEGECAIPAIAETDSKAFLLPYPFSKKRGDLGIKGEDSLR